MKRFLSTTAVALVVATSSFAEGHSTGFGAMTEKTQADFFASDLIGMRIYNSETEVDASAPVADGAEQEWDDIGEINDLIVSPEGEVQAVILGVGGFLGMGERDVSISMDAIKILNEEGDAGDRFLVVTTSKEMLEQSPEFDRRLMDDEAKAEMNEAEAEVEGASNEANAELNEAEAEANAEMNEAEAEMKTEDHAMTSDSERPMLERPAVEREGYANMDAAAIEELTAEDLEGSYVYGANDETVGEIDSIVLTDDGKVEKVVINVGGFLGLGEKPVAVTFDELQVLRNVDGDETRIYIDSTQEALEAQPEYEG